MQPLATGGTGLGGGEGEGGGEGGGGDGGGGEGGGGSGEGGGTRHCSTGNPTPPPRGFRDTHTRQLELLYRVWARLICPEPEQQRHPTFALTALGGALSRWPLIE